MSNYYALVAGLPNIAIDDSKLTYSIEAFRDEIYDSLTAPDKELIDLFFYKFDNKNLLTYLRDPETPFDPKGNIRHAEMEELVKTVKGGDPYKGKGIPPYFTPFLEEYFQTEKTDDISWEDRLASYYYEYAMKASNWFVAAWFELNLNINNISAALVSRKFGLDKNLYIIGHNDVAEAIRTSNARDFGLGDSLDYLPALQRLAEDPDLMERERKTDLLKWNWIEENTFFNYFSVERIFAYLLQLEMIQRWVSLDKEAGEKMFRSLIQGMKKESLVTLDEFNRNHNK